ncbi:RING finger protein 214 isoform X2 [Clupea harengus]|uniref:RING finger protein 214 isoform X2 n=1 Tax=Clupea harengus TaxID=7950 RepID=A0A6P3W9S7_CLUHA|nr:RING finger protein 214 isoform X2 [Clupea harengus]
MKNKCELTSSASPETDKEVPSGSPMEDKAVNTDPDWETKMRLLEEETRILIRLCEDLKHQREAGVVDHKMRLKNVEHMINDKKCQHQTLLEKLDSMNLKLEHSKRKANQKKFLAKQEELLTELKQVEEKGRSLTVELEEKEEALVKLEGEQVLQKETWEQEIADLREERDRLKKEVEEGSRNALREEIEALEFQREVYVSELEEWLAEAEKHIQSLRLNPSPEYLHHSLEWERKVATIRSTVSSLQEHFNKMIQQIQQGQMLEDLPTVTLPPLPEIPVLLYFSQPTHVVSSQPYGFMARPFAPQMPPFYSSPVRMSHVGPASQSIARPAFGPGAPAAPASHPMFQAAHPGMAPSIRGLAPGYTGAAPQRPVPQTTVSPLASPPPAAAAAAQPSQLDKVLQMLGTRLPTRTRAELTVALQQIKSARGTLAGMAMEDLCQQVAERLEHSQKPVMTPIGHPPVGVSPHLSKLQQPSNLPQGIQSVVSLCLVCQGHVDERSQYKMRCSHIIHTQCVRVWLQSGTKKECPICPD